VDVDEAGRDHFASGIQFIESATSDSADRRNAAILNSHIAQARSTAATVVFHRRE
jgi:hypothetical protein